MKIFQLFTIYYYATMQILQQYRKKDVELQIPLSMQNYHITEVNKTIILYL